MACTKITIMEKLIDRYDWSRSEAAETIEALLEIIKETLSSGEEIMLSGFGKFQVNEKSQRKGRNPATGKEMMIGKKRVVTFKCAGKLRDEINKN